METTTETAPAQEATFEIVPAELGLEPAAKSSLELAFAGFFQRAREFSAKAKTITDPKQARALRLEIKSDRVATEKVRKSLKEDSLRMGKAIDGANNIYLALVAPIEQELDDIEKAEERAEAARIEALREERAETLDSLGHVSHGLNLGTMTEESWKEYLQQAKDVYELREARKKREAEEAAAELTRQEEEREAARLEAIRLREEAEANAAAAKAERDAIEAEAAEERRKALEAAALAAKEKAAAEAEAQRLRDAEAARVKAEKDAADAKAKAEALAARKAAAAPDKAKIAVYAETIKALGIPSLTADGLTAQLNAARESFLSIIREIYATL